MDHKKVKGIAVLLGNMLRALKVNGMEWTNRSIVMMIIVYKWLQYILKSLCTCPELANLLHLFLVGEHCHQFIPTTVDKKARRKLIIASILCVVFMIGEVIGKFKPYMFV
jgi:hypothetical protein